MVESHLLPRRATETVREALSSSRVVLLHGPRQSGKSTLGRLLATELGMDYVTFDDAAQLAAARADPTTFLESRQRPVVLDEVQRAGNELIVAIKADVDRVGDRGRYLLTGSTNFLTVPSLAESLTGRLRIVRLWPLSAGELLGGSDDFIDRAFRGPSELLSHNGTTFSRDEYLQIACQGGFPGVQDLNPRTRVAWFDDYLDTLIQREIAAAADIRRLGALRQLARYLGANSSGELVVGRLASDLGMDRATVESYIGWLETAFVIHRVPSWSRNLTAKVVRRPKLFVGDSGIAASLMGKSPEALRDPTESATGRVMETFAVNELCKQSTWSDTMVEVSHFRDADGREVDAVLEARDGRIVGVEIKTSSTPRTDDFRWLSDMRSRVDRAGGKFVAGVVLHTGGDRLPFGDRLVALPIGDLWSSS
jgi:uncharacterized protein